MVNIEGTFAGATLDNTTLQVTSLAPGQSEAWIVHGVTATAGQSYVLVLIVTYSDGSTSTASQSVQVGQYNNTAPKSINIQVVSATIVPVGSQSLIMISIKNTGNVPLSACTATFYLDANGEQLNLGAIAPGHTASASSDLLSHTVDPSTGYAVVVTGSNSQTGDSVTASLTVTPS